MKREGSRSALAGSKAPSGIAGFDEITGGGLPRGRTTLLVGGPGSGKTIFSLQFLSNSARNEDDGGIFVAFEETSTRIRSNVEGFDWNLDQAGHKKIAFIDAQPDPDVVQAGTFDLLGLLASIEMTAKATGAKRIVFDALDVLLTLLPDAISQRREVHRLHQWLLTAGFTALITAKAADSETTAYSAHPFGFMQFMVDCMVILNHSVVLGVSQRSLRVQKYRGSAFNENEYPLVIGTAGVEIALSRALGSADAEVSSERVSSGIERLDTMLGGGYFRSANVLIVDFHRILTHVFHRILTHPE